MTRPLPLTGDFSRVDCGELRRGQNGKKSGDTQSLLLRFRSLVTPIPLLPDTYIHLTCLPSFSLDKPRVEPQRPPHWSWVLESNGQFHRRDALSGEAGLPPHHGAQDVVEGGGYGAAVCDS